MFIAFRLKHGRDDDSIGWLASMSVDDRFCYIRGILKSGLYATLLAEPISNLGYDFKIVH